MHMTRSEWKKRKVVLKRKNSVKKYGKVAAFGTVAVIFLGGVGYYSTISKDQPVAAQNEIEIANQNKTVLTSEKTISKGQEKPAEGKDVNRANEIAKAVSKGNGVLLKMEEAKNKVTEKNNAYSKSNKVNSSFSNTIGFNNPVMTKSHLLIDSEKVSLLPVSSGMNVTENTSSALLSNVSSNSLNISKQGNFITKTPKKEEELLKMNSDYKTNEETKELKTMEGAKDIEASKVQANNPNKMETVAVSEDILETAGTFTGRFGDNTIILDMDGEEGSFYTNESSMKDKLKKYNVGSYLDVRYSKDTNNYNRINDVFLIHNGATNNSREFEALYVGKHQNVVSLKEAESQPKEYEMSNYFAKENKNFLPGSQVWVVGANDETGFKVENISVLENPKPKTMLLTSRPATAAKKEEKTSVKPAEVQPSKADLVKENLKEVQPKVKPKQEEVVQNTVDNKIDTTTTVEQQSKNNVDSTVETTKVTPVSTNEEAPVEFSVNPEQTANTVEADEKDGITNSLEEKKTTDSLEEETANNLAVQPEEEKTN